MDEMDVDKIALELIVDEQLMSSKIPVSPLILLNVYTGISAIYIYYTKSRLLESRFADIP